MDGSLANCCKFSTADRHPQEINAHYRYCVLNITNSADLVTRAGAPIFRVYQLRHPAAAKPGPAAAVSTATQSPRPGLGNSGGAALWQVESTRGRQQGVGVAGHPERPGGAGDVGVRNCRDIRCWQRAECRRRLPYPAGAPSNFHFIFACSQLPLGVTG